MHVDDDDGWWVDFAPPLMRRRGKIVLVLQYLSAALILTPPIGLLTIGLLSEGWPPSMGQWLLATAVGGGVFLVLIETRLANLVNEIQEINWLLRTMVKQRGQ